MAVSRDKILKGAEKLVLKGKIEPAIREYEKLLKLNPNDVNTINRIGDLYNRVGQVDKAVELYERIAESFSRDGFSNKAIAIYKKINRLAPDKVEIFKRLAELYIQQGLIFEAKSQYQILADWFAKKDDLENAIQVQRELVEIDSDNHMAHLRLADLLFRHGSGEEAISVYDRLGSMLLDRGKLEEAERLYRHSIEQDPPSGEFLAPICEALITSGNLQAAGEFLTEARKRSPENRGLRTMGVRLALAAGENSRAVAEASTLLREHEGDPEVAFLAGRAFFANGDEHEGRNQLVSAATLSSEAGDVAMAQEVFQQLIASLPRDREVLQLGMRILASADDGDVEFTLKAALADGFFRIGDSAHARQLYSQLLLQDSGNNLFKTRLKELDSAGAAAQSGQPGVVETADRADGPPHVGAGTAPDDEPEIIEIEIPGELPLETGGGDEPVFDDSEAQEEAGFDPQERMAEATVFAKYGLVDKAIHHLEQIVQFFPEHELAREKLVVLAIEAGQRDLAQQYAGPLVEIYRRQQKKDRVDKLFEALPELDETGAAASDDGRIDSDADLPDGIEDELIVEIDEELGFEASGMGAAAETFDGATGFDDEIELVELEEVDIDDLEPRQIQGDEDEAIEYVETDQEVGFDTVLFGEGTDEGPMELSDDFDTPVGEVAWAGGPDGVSTDDAPAGADAEDADVVDLLDSSDLPEPSFDDMVSIDVVDEDHDDGLRAPGPELSPADDLAPKSSDVEPVDLALEAEQRGQSAWPDSSEEAASGRHSADVLDELAALEQSVLSRPERVQHGGSTSDDSAVRMADSVVADAVGGIDGPSRVDLEQMDSFIEMSLYEDATRLLGNLESTYPEHPEVAKRRTALKAKGVLMEDVPTAAEASEDLFSDEEEEYVDLAAELEEEMAAEEAVVEEAAGSGGGEAELEEVFREFQKGVAEQLSEEDSDTHFNLGIAYKEMGLLPEAIREFQISSRNPEFFVESCSMIGVCYVEQGLWEQAASWYEKALEMPGLPPDSTTALKYDLATTLENGGEAMRAVEVFEDILAIDPAFRDVSARLEVLAGHQQAN